MNHTAGKECLEYAKHKFSASEILLKSEMIIMAEKLSCEKYIIVCYWVSQIVRVLLPSCLTPPMKGGSIVPEWKQAKAKPTLPVPLWSCIMFAKYYATAKEKLTSKHESCL